MSRYVSHNVDAARDLRQHQTGTEERLWTELRARNLDGIKVRRQHPIGPYVVDFCCPTLGLVIEVDGAVHDGRSVEDADRTAVLEDAGYRVVRFRNEEVRHDMDRVLERIRSAAEELRSRPLPKRIGRGV